PRKPGPGAAQPKPKVRKILDTTLQQWAPWPRPRAHDECLLGRRCHTHPLPHVLSSPLKSEGRHSKNLKISARKPVMLHELPDIFLAVRGLLDAGECEHAIGTCRGSQVRKRRKHFQIGKSGLPQAILNLEGRKQQEMVNDDKTFQLFISFTSMKHVNVIGKLKPLPQEISDRHTLPHDSFFSIFVDSLNNFRRYRHNGNRVPAFY